MFKKHPKGQGVIEYTGGLLVVALLVGSVISIAPKEAKKFNRKVMKEVTRTLNV